MIKFDYKNTEYNCLPSFQKCIQSLSRRFDDAQDEISRLAKENEQLRSEHYKDEEIDKLKKAYDTVLEAMNRGFPLSKKESEAANIWLKTHNDTVHSGAQHGAIGGGYEFIFYPTGIGTFGTVRCTSCGEKFEFQTP